jgi:hypothetical protein
MTDLCSGQALGDADADTDDDADNDNDAADKSNPYMSPFSRRHKKQHVGQVYTFLGV